MKVFWVCMENLLTTSWPLVSAASLLFLEEKCGGSENTTREEHSVSSRDNSLSHSVSSHRGRQVCGHTSEEWLTSPSQLKWSPSVKQAQNWCTVLTPQGSGSGSQIICCSKCSLRAPTPVHTLDLNALSSHIPFCLTAHANLFPKRHKEQMASLSLYPSTVHTIQQCP